MCICCGVYAVGYKSICCGEQHFMLWGTTLYAVGTLCCGYMLWGRTSPHGYTLGVKNRVLALWPESYICCGERFICCGVYVVGNVVYVVGNVWVYDVGNVVYAVGNVVYAVGIAPF